MFSLPRNQSASCTGSQGAPSGFARNPAMWQAGTLAAQEWSKKTNSKTTRLTADRKARPVICKDLRSTQPPPLNRPRPSAHILLHTAECTPRAHNARSKEKAAALYLRNPDINILRTTVHIRLRGSCPRRSVITQEYVLLFGR